MHCGLQLALISTCLERTISTQRNFISPADWRTFRDSGLPSGLDVEQPEGESSAFVRKWLPGNNQKLINQYN